MKKLSLKAKKTIIYVVTVALIVALIAGVILSLGVVRAGALDDEYVNLLNDINYYDLGENGTPSTFALNGTIYAEDGVWSGNLLDASNSNGVKAYFPSFECDSSLFHSTSLPSYISPSIYCYYAVLLRVDNVDNLRQIFYQNGWNEDSDGNGGNSSGNITAFTSSEFVIVIDAIYCGESRSFDTRYINDYYIFLWYDWNPGLNIEVIGGACGISATDVIADIIDMRDSLIVPTDVVYGTDEFTIYDYSETQRMLYANLTPVWDPFYAGFVGRVATADGTSVPVMYTWTIDGLNATNGNVVVLDPAFHDYVTQLSLQSHVSNGSLELLIDKTMDVRYIAVSDNFTLLSSDLIDQANKLQLIQDEINAAYNDGYLEGYELGVKKALSGVFGNAQMTVALYVYDPVTGVEAPLLYYVPINVANGGMDLTSIWKLWSDSPLNDGNHMLSWIQVTISFDNGVLWSNDLLYFKFNTPVTANQLPYDAYLLTVENSSQNYNVSFVERNGLWYWQTAASLDGYSVSDISFKINNQHISYYNFLEGYNTTLNNNIQTFGTNQASYDRGFDDGYIDGVDDGFSDGIVQSSQVSWMEGHSAGYDEGRNVGYNVGYEDGLRDDYRFYDLFFSLFDAELNVFKSIVSFEIFGVNVAGFVLGLVTIGVVAFVIRKVW